MTMTPEEMLQQLMEQGKITQEDIQELNLSTSNQSFRTLVEGLHALLCAADHDVGECRFHEETIKERTWKRSFHQKWTIYARELVLCSNVSPDRLLDDIRRVSHIVKTIQEMTSGGIEILRDVLGMQQIDLNQGVHYMPPKTPSSPSEETS